jgi:hypothetical protein
MVGWSMGASLLIVAARLAGSSRLALMNGVAKVVRVAMSGVAKAVRGRLARAVVVLGVAAVAGVGALAQVASGLYGNLVLGVNGTAVTGVFANSRAGKSTQEEPQFRCSFLLRGTAGADGSGAMPVTVWMPGAAPSDGAAGNGAQTKGTLTVEQGTAKLSLEGEPPGCGETGDRFVAKPYEEPAVKTGGWLAARMVSGVGVRLQEAPVSGSSGRGRVSKGEVVVVDRKIGPWLEVETVFTQRPVRGWLREGDLYGSEP